MVRTIVALCAAACAVPMTAMNAQQPSAAPPVRPTVKTTVRIASEAGPATVTIIAIDASGDTVGQGSGFIVSSDGIILTNWHVLEGAASAVVILSTRERFDKVSFLEGDSIADLAILKIPGYDLPTLPTRASIPAVGEKVVAIGSPQGLSQTVSEGIVSATRLDRGKQLVQITAPISPGSSGGAVLDTQGRVFAISTAFRADGQLLNFAVPIKYALGLIRPDLKAIPLATAFASSAPRDESAGSTNASKPARASSPRPSLWGTYTILRRWYGPSRQLLHTDRGLLIAEKDIGFMVVASELSDGSLRDAKAYSVMALRTSASGQVVLESGSLVYDGYQTDEGFFATSRFDDTAEPDQVHLELAATPHDLPLSSRTGLYDVSVRTNYYIRKKRIGDPTDWTGSAAVVTLRDSVYLDLMLTNPRGGRSGLFARGHLDPDGSFSLASESGKVTYRGTMIAGRLHGLWVDIRDDDARFEGTLVGERR